MLTAEFRDGSTWQGEPKGWVNVRTGERMTDQQYEDKRRGERAFEPAYWKQD